jgi:hypothetical protein
LVVNRFPAPGGPDSVRNSQLLVGCSLSLVELVQSTPTQLMVGWLLATSANGWIDEIVDGLGVLGIRL